jgi:hypothetical protein
MTIKEQLFQEIESTPENLLEETLNFLKSLKTQSLNLERSEHKINEIMKFAGSWSDIFEEDFADFCEEIEQRRQTSSRRFSDETLFT